MSNLQAFGTYAAAFEESLVDDNWARLEQYFSEDASYKPGDGTEGLGRSGVIQSLQDSVNALERKCDAHELIGQPGVTEEGDTITLSFTIKYVKQGVDDFLLVGVETIQYSKGLICKMEDVFESPNDLMAWRTKL
jgi:hypothetical protein